MTREEINQAADAYASQICNDCSVMLYCEERSKKCVEHRKQAKVFVDGAKWADAYPKNVWHPADEEPVGRYWRILCQDEEDGCWVENSNDAIRLHNTWKEFVEEEMIVKWAYIRDLLPKGGEL